jgi:hypothetical protein
MTKKSEDEAKRCKARVTAANQEPCVNRQRRLPSEKLKAGLTCIAVPIGKSTHDRPFEVGHLNGWTEVFAIPPGLSGHYGRIVGTDVNVLNGLNRNPKPAIPPVALLWN